MKKRLTLLGLFFVAMAGMSLRAQITVAYQQNFESTTPQGYSVTTGGAVQTQYVSAGQRSMKMTHTQNSAVTLTLDTLDFSDSASFNYYTLEFSHTAFVNPLKCADPTTVCYVEAKRPGQTVWTKLDNNYYATEGGSVNFQYYGSFAWNSYDNWAAASAMNNTLWTSERFDFERIFQGVSTVNRQVIIRFVVSSRTNTASATEGWYLDDIVIRASSQQIISPKITMRSFPDLRKYPSSRGVRLVADVTTTAAQGICSDSVYAEYRVGSSPVVYRAYMQRTSPTSDRYVGRIPFYGYDTLMHYHVVAKDATRNKNTSTYPKNASQWLTYCCVRGRSHNAPMTGTLTNNSGFPFPSYADNRSEFVYDSTTMANLGYGPGAITSFQYQVNTAPSTVTRAHMQIRMSNVYSSQFSRTSSTNQLPFTSSTMQIMYDSVFKIEQAAAGSYKTVQLQDTFFYAGSDMLVQVLYDETSNLPRASEIKHVPAAAGKLSLFIPGYDANYNYNPFTNIEDFSTGYAANTRPWARFYESANLPLIYDCGISAMAYPSYTVPCNTGNDSVVLWLKNYGVSTINSVGMAYRVDNGAPVHYTWTGVLAAGDSVRVRVNTSQNFTVGYHTIRAWVDDTVTVGTQRFRDHEPYNDSTFTAFASCDGAYSGSRTVGAGGHFASLEKCLYVLSRCGVDGPLVVKLPAGVYDVTKFPYIPGTSAANYVQFEPSTAGGVVTFRRSRGGVNQNADALADLSEARSIRFNNIRFVNGTYGDNRCTVLADLGTNSNNCQFINCAFIDSNSINNMAEALLRTGEADSVLVTRCTFFGGQTGVDVTGTALDNRSVDNTVEFCDFSGQSSTAISVVNQDRVTVDSNYVNDVLTNASQIIKGQHIYNGSRITRNRVYSTKGASCIGMSDIHGTASNYSIVANNMLVSLDDGTTNQLVTPFNIIQGSYTLVVFNSVRMKAPTRVAVAAATFGGGTGISNCRFQNNVIASFDSSNYAFSYIPGNNRSTNQVNHNCYYSVSSQLNRLYTTQGNTNYANLAAWQAAITEDVGSVSGDPNFTNGAICNVDLRSFSDLLRGAGTFISQVTNDIYDSVRSNPPAMGAYEVATLRWNFSPVEMLSPFADYCGAPANIPIKVCIRNTGTDDYVNSSTNPIWIHYKLNNGNEMTFRFNRNVPAGDTAHFLSTNTVNVPAGTKTDATHTIRWWVRCTLDLDEMNDTTVSQVFSRYKAPAPTNYTQNVTYSFPADVTPTTGYDTWPVNYYTGTGTRQMRSNTYWYRSMTDSEPFYVGRTFHSDPVFIDTTFYIAQKRDLPLVKITEVQVKRAGTGATNPMPSWMNTGTNLAVELTNVGDYPAELEGDTIAFILGTTSASKTWVLPRVTIQPHENLVLQVKTMATPTDSSITIFAPSTAVPTVAYNTDFAVVYRDGEGIADAVAFNTINTKSTWTALNMPQSVWKGGPISLSTGGSNVAGARRITWPTGAASGTPSNSATQWEISTVNPMHVGTTEENLIRYTDNGCESPRGTVTLHITNMPSTDLAVDEPVVDTGCDLTANETVSVIVHNYGNQAASNIQVKLSLNGGSTVYSTTSIASLPMRGAQTVTFPNTLNMAVQRDTTFHLMAWVDAAPSDLNRSNDTSRTTALARFTPPMPSIVSPQSTPYNSQLPLVASNADSSRMMLAWYDASHQPLDTTGSRYLTHNIFHNDTFYCKAIALNVVPNTHVGTLASTMNNNFPSPYNPKMKYVKEQYIYTADQIIAAGHGAGTISSIAFNLAALGSNVNTFNFSNYQIKIGTTTQATFANANFITQAAGQFQTVYSNNNLTLTRDNIGWVTHNLDTPYQWDGTSNLVIEIVRTLSTSSISAGANTRYTAQANTVITKQHATADQSAATSGTKGNNRPDILFGFLEPVGCESPEKEVLVTVTNVPSVDASIYWPTWLDTATIASCASTSLNVMLRNQGSSNISAYTLRYKVDNGSWQQTSGTLSPALPLGYDREVQLLSQHLNAGRHRITAVVNVNGDNVHNNDTIVRVFNVKFCAGTYEVGNTAGANGYPSLVVAVDTLRNAGVAGPVIFNLNSQVFNGQIELGAVDGISSTNTVTFQTNPQWGTPARITHTPTSTNNYVLRVADANNFIFQRVDFYANWTSGSGNNLFANVVKVEGSDHIQFNECTLRSKKSTAPSSNANIMLLGDDNHYITIDNCVLDSGYSSITTVGNTHSDNITITNCDLTNFLYRGIYLRDCDTLLIQHDSLAAGAAANNRALTGISVANGRQVRIEKNFVYLIDTYTGAKVGINVVNCKGNNLDRVSLTNNMVSIFGGSNAASRGFVVDTTCKFVNVLFNTAVVNTGATQVNTRTFTCGRSSNVHVMNNIFANYSTGYAYYVEYDTNIANSNFNAYYSNSVPNATTGKRNFAYWGGSSCTSLDSLRTVNQKDNNSVEDRPYFVDSVSNLRVSLAQFSTLAQYNPDVQQDIFDNIRPQIPAPTIGAHEFGRLVHNVSIAEIVDPRMPAVTTGTSAIVYNIETDTIKIRVKFYNNGSAPEYNLTWYAQIAGRPDLSSSMRSISTLRTRSLYEDSTFIISPLGLLDTQQVVVVIDCPGDNDPDDNVDTVSFFIYPAFNLKVSKIEIINNTPAGCRLFAVPITYTVKNEGKKDFPGDVPITLGWDFYCQGNTQPTSGFPGYSMQGETTTLGGALPIGTETTVTNVTDLPNIYPHGLTSDITVKMRGYVTYQYDVKHNNDTSSYISISSNHTPVLPVTHDTLLDYGTYGNLWSTQSQSRPLRWARDTTDGVYFYADNNYGRSTHWSNTPQYFHDSTYYVTCFSAKGCTSYYRPINVSINPPLEKDVSISQVLSPRASGRVYLEKDTVKLRLVNYGSEPISNIPVHFKLMNANERTVYMEVDDTAICNIPGRVGDNVSYYDFVFDSLMDLKSFVSSCPIPNSDITFKLQAWVAHVDDMQRGNDTLRTSHSFKALAERVYDSILSKEPDFVEGFDIKRVSYNTLDNMMPDLIGYSSVVLAGYNPTDNHIPCLHVTPGTMDTLIVEVANNQNENDKSTGANLCVAIDYNRDGQYDLAGNENITKSLTSWGVRVRSRQPYYIPLTIPTYAHYGYMRMMVWVDGDTLVNTSHNPFHTGTVNGQMQQYMLFVDDPNTLPDVDAAVTRLVSPRQEFKRKRNVSDTNHSCMIMLANKGKIPLASADVFANFSNPERSQTRVVHWTGNLDPGQSTPVTFDSITFYEGITDAHFNVIVPGDSNDANNSFNYRFNIPYTVTLRFIDSFDEGIDKWFLPAGYNNYTRNYFERGVPSKSHITSALSLPNAYITDSVSAIVTSTRGNRSELYTPVIDISQIKPDTLTFDLCKHMLANSHLVLEFVDYQGVWQKVDIAEAPKDGTTTTTWYDDEEGWTGSSNGQYVHYSVPTSLISGDFPQDVQFRFVYTASPEGNNKGDGVAIDNFRIGRARRSKDVGVTDITYPTRPKFGQTIQPKVIIHNYGSDTIQDFRVAYLAPGNYLPSLANCPLAIAPDEEVEFEFGPEHAFIIRNNCPDTFQIAAFTRVGEDIYYDNDTCYKQFVLAPLDNDLQMYSIVSPLASVVGGDSINITARVRNFGQNDINECDFYYTYNRGEVYHDHVNFLQVLGRPLSSMEFFNHTYTQRQRATMGTLSVTAWCKYNADTYPYNDTLTKQSSGIAAISDGYAKGVLVDTRSHTVVKIGLVIENSGALAINNFPVAFYYDNDTSTIYYDTVRLYEPLRAGGHMVHTFGIDLPVRSAEWKYFKAWLSVPGDTNHTNDTTSILAEMVVDLAMRYVEVEENREPTCRVRFAIENLGTVPYYSGLNIEASINGVKKTSHTAAYQYVLEPGQIRHVMFEDSNRVAYTIDKSPTRTYVGYAKLKAVNGDIDLTNNESDIVNVVNYFEGIPKVNESGFVLEQNYPNPFDEATQIEFSIPSSGNVRMMVCDVLGRQVYSANATYNEGRHVVVFDRDKLSAGIYYYTLEFNGERRMLKMTVR